MQHRAKPQRLRIIPSNIVWTKTNGPARRPLHTPDEERWERKAAAAAAAHQEGLPDSLEHAPRTNSTNSSVLLRADSSLKSNSKVRRNSSTVSAVGVLPSHRQFDTEGQDPPEKNRHERRYEPTAGRRGSNSDKEVRLNYPEYKNRVGAGQHEVSILGRILEVNNSDIDRRGVGQLSRHKRRDASGHNSSSPKPDPSQANIHKHRAGSSSHREQLRRSLRPPSSLSVFSSFTQTSKSSSGSNSTITPKTLSRSAPRKKKRTKQTRTPVDSDSEHIMPKKGRRTKGADAPNAFDYLAEESHSPKSAPSDLAFSSEYQILDSGAPHVPAALEFSSKDLVSKAARRDSWAPHASFSSDSGISVRGSSPDPSSKGSITGKQPTVEDVNEEDEEEEEEDDDDDDLEDDEAHDHHHDHHHPHQDEDDDDDDDEEEDSDDHHANAEKRLRSTNTDYEYTLKEKSSSSDEDSGGSSESDTAHHQALARIAPPVAPQPGSRSSSGSGDSDREHVRQMSRQEDDLRQYMYRSPAPPQPVYPHPSPAPQSIHPAQAAYPVPAYAWPPQVPQAPLQAPHPYAHQQLDRSKRTVNGYELVAMKLSEVAFDAPLEKRQDAITPMYRRFEALNHRLLLHLQDELAEYEEELRVLDEYIAQTTPDDQMGRTRPASRRIEARYGSDTHRRRTELLGNVFIKMGQYNQALASYREATKSFETANPDAVREYRAWMDEHQPLEKKEMRFLECKGDLMALRYTQTPAAGGNNSLSHATLALPLVLLLPLLTFKVITGFLGRILILVIIGYTEAAIVSSSTGLSQLMSYRSWTMCAAAYFAFMAVAACIL